MNGRLKLIEQQLLGIDSAAFQNLCDIYLAFREQPFASINRTGSQFGKQKTVKGTPDTFFRLPDGTLRYVEFTTKTEGLVDKIKHDIDKCLDPTLTGVPPNEVYKIIIFFNSRLNVNEETTIVQHALLNNIRLELIGIDWLALEIYSKYLILAKDILGIPLDTGQLLPLQNFIAEYNNKAGKLSTPLDNKFLHRKIELDNIEDILATNDLLIISGFPGVGKTKIALEAIDKFLFKNKEYSALAVSKKDQDISEDLKIHLQQEQNYLLLVDDANRQLLNFKQIMGIFKEKRVGSIKLIVTVRDYALIDVTNECQEYNPHKIILKKFSDEEITKIIASDSFKIRNKEYQTRIVELADGNARLAVMAARIAMQRQESFLLGDVSDLYDTYFQTFIKDFDIFGKKTLIKSLGIISFFFTIDRSNKEFIEDVLKNFELDYHDFNEAIDELEKRELVEVQYNHARVSEQVMATYFFYKVFIKDEILPFQTLLFAYFPVEKKRFFDTIIPSNNSFGYQNVFEKINGNLNEYLNSIYTKEESVFEFFSLFWFYKRDETLSYFYKKVKQIPEAAELVYNSKYETNDFVWDRDKILDFLSKLFTYYTESFIPALELAFEYSRKKPETLPELIRRIRENILFDHEDQRNNFQRQVELFNLLTRNFKENKPHYIEAFFELSETFLSHHYQITKGGRNNSITLYKYRLPFNNTIKEFRKSIWITLFESYNTYPNRVMSILKNFRPGYKEPTPEILDFDLTLLLPFLDNRLDYTKFEHIHFIHDFILMLDKVELDNKEYKLLYLKFKSKEYDLFCKLDWNIFRGKHKYDFKKFEGFKRLKEQELRIHFTFKNETEFTALHTAIKNSLLIEEDNKWGLNQALNIIAEENFLKNNELGFKLLISFLENYPVGLQPLHNVIRLIAHKSPEWALRLWNLINGWEHEYRLYWQLSFFDYLPSKLANNFYKKALLKTIKSIDRGCSLQFDNFEIFTQIKSENIKNKTGRFLMNLPIFRNLINYKEINIIEEILSIVYDKVENQGLRINLPFQFFEKYSEMIAHNFELLKKSYIQQEKNANYPFDLQNEGLKKLILIRPNFLLEYIDSFYKDKISLQNRNTYAQLSFVWDLKNCDALIKESMIIIIENNYYSGIGEHPLIIFFNHLTDKQKEKAKVFLKRFIDDNYHDEKIMNPVFEVLRHRLKEFYEEAFLYYLSLNTDLESFSKIWWRGNGGTYSGDEIIGEIHAREWQKILDMVVKSNNQLDLIPIKTYIKKQIEYDLQRGQDERKRRFINPSGW